MTEVKLRIVIVGGGTAGWLTANILRSALGADQRKVDIALVESRSIGRIGVGEATIPTLRRTLSEIGIDEATFMRRTDATFKHAIKFTDWHKPPGSSHPSYYHTFERFGTVQERFGSPYYGELQSKLRASRTDVAAFWLRRRRQGVSVPFAFECGIQPYLCDAFRAPKMRGAPAFEGSVPYAYHTNAELFADLLLETGVARGIKHFTDEVISVGLSDDGRIDHVRTKENGTIEGDLFVDCTGFAAALISKVLGSQFTSFSDWLLCDRAVALPIAHDMQGKTKARLRPYTSSTALEAGWVWEIDLTTRSGTGYVYSSAHISDDDAERRLREFLGGKGADVTARRIPMRIGHRTTPWVKNCVAIGLSAGFLEPLESTGIYLVEIGARWLAENIGFAHTSQKIRDRYNSAMSRQFEEIRDFLVMHYCMSDRDDSPFWQDVRHSNRIPGTVQAKLDLWAAAPIAEIDFTGQVNLFSKENYEAVLYGMDKFPSDPVGASAISDLDQDLVFRLNRVNAQKALIELPEHGELIQSLTEEVGMARQETPIGGQSATLGRRLLGRIQAKSALNLPGDWQVLRPGLVVSVPDNFFSRVRLSQGTCTVGEAGLAPADYKPGAIVPRSPWKSLSPSEANLLTRTTSAVRTDFVSVVRPPTDLVEQIRTLVGDAGSGRFVPDFTARNGNAELVESVADRLAESFCAPLRDRRTLGLDIERREPGTVTRDLSDNLKLGLHIDTWSKSHRADLLAAPNRMCLNIGTQSRYLIFSNILYHDALRLLGDHPDLDRRTPTDNARWFLALTPHYPVVRVEIRPGEAYIAPTDNLIHDGMNDGSAEPDVKFSVLGHFPFVPGGEEIIDPNS